MGDSLSHATLWDGYESISGKAIRNPKDRENHKYNDPINEHFQVCSYCEKDS